MINKKIEEQLLKEQEERKGRIRSGKYIISSLGRCYRSQYWQRKNEPATNPPDARTLKVFKAGKLFHDFVEGFFDTHETEVAVENDHFKGFADIVLEDRVIDIKSQHSRGFWYMAKSDYDVTTQKLTNILQCGAYAYMLDKEKFGLVFVSKDDLCVEEYHFKTEDWANRIVEEMDVLKEIWVKDELPLAKPRAYPDKDGKPRECQYCSYKDKCKRKETK